MDIRIKRGPRRIAIALLLAAGLGGCVYAPPYAAYDPYYSGYHYPTYVGPPVSLDLGFGSYKHHHFYRGHRGGQHGGYRHGWGHGRGRR